MKTPEQIAEETTRRNFDTYEDSAQEVNHPEGQPIVETRPALIASVTAAIKADRAQVIRVGDLVESVRSPGLDSRRVIAIGGEGADAWLWVDLHQKQLDDGELPTRFPLVNYRKVGSEPLSPPREPCKLDPLEERKTQWALAWTIDEEANSAAKAAVGIWQDSFCRGTSQPSADESCVFIVTDRNTNESVSVDLSDAQFEHLFAN